MMNLTAASKFNVGGVRLDQPFKIRRLGHFGLNFRRLAEAVHFYKDLMGFRITDIRDFSKGGARAVPPEYRDFGDLNGYFMRYAHDHHAFVLYNHHLRKAQGRIKNEQVTVNQITWQVGSLAEVVNGFRWFNERGWKVRKTGRDMPGSNWHVYLNDPDGHNTELYYGIEQIGWDGHSKPRAMHDRIFEDTPDLPQISEYAEVNAALQRNVPPSATVACPEFELPTRSVKGREEAALINVMSTGTGPGPGKVMLPESETNVLPSGWLFTASACCVISQAVSFRFRAE